MERGSVGATLAVARGQGGRIATTSVRAGLAMTGFLQGVRWDGGTHGSRPTIVFFVGQGPRALPWVRRLSAGGLRAARPTEVQYEVRRGGALLPTVVPTDWRALSYPPIGALPRNRLASSATGGASPISPPAGDREGRPYGREQGARRLSGGAEPRPYA